ncbi:MULTISPECIES: ATP/GTP-binding protein [unclassified Streptomyces]|uniref:ATP/GTP-binding protein n=1 Tax=unclassified Streptomyces TaxID=2593676 RepID=UPI002E76244F|nr:MULTISPECIES: ATP/GTP-binding protein [unclassified Streptomyces]MEE1764642.1 ATP/GTP-binding protein [Streptomyces sp. SP18BB07]MEE1833643.1 ATP/GTP-binding protein [Streptomyces sp. SP17KL33]
MSPRRNRPKDSGASGPSGPSGRSADEDPSDRYGGWQTSEPWRGEEWSVRHVAGASAAGKTYRCPGCDQMIPSGVPHVVAWPEHSGVDERRHWHKACWNAKDRRTSRVQRSRNAPRF